MAPRQACCSPGTRRSPQRSTPLMARSPRGITQGGVRWNSARRSTWGWISGTNWMAEAPVPITATRSPLRSWSWSQRAEWNTVPAKSPSPGRSGTDGSLSGPMPATSTRATISPCEVAMRQRWASSSHRAPWTSWPKRMWGRTPKRSAQPRR
jgi:hypothetical protein